MKGAITEKDRFLGRTSFKNVSGNWQFKGEVTPDVVWREIGGLKDAQYQHFLNWYLSDGQAFEFNQSTLHNSPLPFSELLLEYKRQNPQHF